MFHAKHLLIFALLVPMLAAEESPFRSREIKVTSSPDVSSEFHLPAGSKVVDFDLWPTGPEVLILLQDASGYHAVQWRLGSTGITPLLDLPAGFDARSIAVHPAEQLFFVSGRSGTHSKILAGESLNGKWTQHEVYQTAHDLRRLLIAPRPFQVGWDAARKQSVVSYRIFFAERESNGGYSTRSITEDGKREYQVIGPESSYVKLPDVDADPTPNFVASALPTAFHPGGHILFWQDDKGCFQQLGYQRDNWGKPVAVAGNPCGGSLTVAPNGAALLHWKHGEPGVTVIGDRGRTQSQQAKDYQFIATPSSTPDGRGIVGLVERADGQALVYTPIDVPLADVVNAWMFTEDVHDQQAFSKDAGLLRATGDEQLYQLYDTESYECGGYDSATPTRPYLVTTDIFWELVGAAYEGTFIVQERQQAVPSFWAFVEAARRSLESGKSGSPWVLAFEAVAQSRSAATMNSEALHIKNAEGRFKSAAFGGVFDFGELKPRGHYASAPEMMAYFKAVHYLTALAAARGADDLEKLPSEVKAEALQWIAAYQPFIAPSRSPLMWNTTAFVPPAFARHPLDKQQIFPLSWGFDNEVLLSTVYQSAWPQAEQVTGPNGPRVLPSGLDLAAAFGSGFAKSLLKEDIVQFPPLGSVLDTLHERRPKDLSQANLYDEWLDALAVQWADEARFPEVEDGTLWKAKRLQTGLASWATLRHATVLVNEGSAAECGEGGFESVILRPPRGYVEPDSKTFLAIAAVLEEIEKAISGSNHLNGSLPVFDGIDEKTEPLHKGIIHRLKQSADKARLFATIADKESRGEELSDAEYEEILYVGRVAEHDLLIYKSLANKDLALSIPDPMMKVADVAGGSAVPLLEVAVGRPLEWDQTVPYFGRREIVKGSVYSYYEFSSPVAMNDRQWAGKVENDGGLNITSKGGKVEAQPRPEWVKEFITSERLSCPAKEPF
jgi:hypothetical protein